MNDMEQDKGRSLPNNRYYLELGSVPETVSFLDIWDAITSRKLIITIVTAVFLTLFGLLALTLPTKYRAEVLVAEADFLHESSSSGSSATLDIGVGNMANEALAMITSRSLLSRYIIDHDLLPILFAKDWDPVTASWAMGKNKEPPTVLGGHKKLVEDVIDVTTEAETNLTTVAVQWTDPLIAQSWANGIVQEVNDVLRKRAIDEAERSLEYLSKELQVTDSVELQQSLFELIKIQKAKIVAANVHGEYAFRIIDPAVVPEEPAVPHLTFILLSVGAIIGTFMGLTLALMLNLIKAAQQSRQAKPSFNDE
jgi:uncharacterized protein involved in exopolysaccharide biosynthesis